MKLDRFFQLFVVKERKFYPLYIAQAENIENGAQKLLQLVKEQEYAKQKEIYREIKRFETKGDQVTLTIYNELRASFVTPFDREDVNTLASRLDTFLDFIHDASRRIILYQPKVIDQKLVDIINYIVEDARILSSIMAELERMHWNAKFIAQKCAHIQDIEHAVDDLYEEYMLHIFENEKDAIELVKLKNIVQALEDATDRAKEICDTIKNILLKSA